MLGQQVPGNGVLRLYRFPLHFGYSAPRSAFWAG